MATVNFVYVGRDHLRGLEQEFARGIGAALPGWTSTESVLRTKKMAVNVTFFIYRRAHIMMSHGVADKNYLLRRDPAGGFEAEKYRYVCVPGDWMKRKLLQTNGLSLSEDAVRVVGWPRIDNLIAAAAERATRSPPRRHSGRKSIKVLWAPTHQGGGDDGYPVSSYPGLLRYEPALSVLFDYDRALHPSLVPGQPSTFDKLLDADVVIADRGTLVYEAWALGKPVIFPSWLIGAGNRSKALGSAENLIHTQKIGSHADSFDDMVSMIQSVDSLGPDVTSFMQDYLPERTLGKSYNLIAETVADVWASNDLSIRPKVKADPLCS